MRAKSSSTTERLLLRLVPALTAKGVRWRAGEPRVRVLRRCPATEHDIAALHDVLAREGAQKHADPHAIATA